MLNGSVIDVDKLDYLIRDAYVTGYDSVSLDVDRLLESYTIIESKGKKRVAYKRGALSVIEKSFMRMILSIDGYRIILRFYMIVNCLSMQSDIMIHI